MKSAEATLEVPEPEVEAAEEGEPTFSAWRLVALVAALVALGLWQGWRLLLIIGALVVMIFLHELGHFVMARRAGMKVTQFFLGFGPRIWSFRRGEVEYGIKAIPAGAYVRIIGMMNIDEVPPEDEARTYRQQGFWDRIGVAVAGSTVHFILAILLAFAALVAFGRTDSSAWTVDQPTAGSAARAMGLHTGDRVVTVAGHSVDSFEAMSSQVQKHPDQVVTIGYIRDGRHYDTSVRLGAKAPIYGTVGEDFDLGLRGGVVRLNSVDPQGVIYQSGLRDNDEIASINGVPIRTAADVTAAAKAAKAGTLVVVTRGGATHTVDLGTAVEAGRATGFLGVAQNPGRVSVTPWHAVSTAFSQFGTVAAQSIEGIGKVFSPSHLASFASHTVSNTTANVTKTPTSAQTTSKQQLSAAENRPVSIIGIVGLGKQLTDWGAFLEFLAAINIVIGVLNLIPLLPFDGGHVAVACYERIRELLRRDHQRYFVDAAKLMPAVYAVVLVLGSIMLLAGYTDIVHPLQL